MLVSKITFKRDTTTGSTTVLELKDPAAFATEPKQESGPAASAKDAPIEAETDLQARFAENAARRQQQIREGV
jgi:prophage tail gpP-like protein